MVPGEGRLTAEVIRNNVVERVEKFGLCVKTDCIMGTNDGCTTMEKYGRLLDKLIQFCLAHGFQLAVVKGIYILLSKPKKKKNSLSVAFENGNDSEVENDSEDEESDEEDRYVFEDENELQYEPEDENDDNDESGLVIEAPTEILKFQGM